MTWMRSGRLAVVLLCGALLAGCGSGGSTTSGSTSTPAATTAATSTPASTTTSTPASSTPSTTTPTGAIPTPGSAAAVAEYAAICKTIIQRTPTLSASVKEKVEGICAKAAHGDLAGARQAAKEVCVEVINASPVPAAAKEKALAECKAA
jgi:hypothetical protein